MGPVDTQSLRNLSLSQALRKPGGPRIGGDHLSYVHHRIYRR